MESNPQKIEEEDKKEEIKKEEEDKKEEIKKEEEDKKEEIKKEEEDKKEEIKKEEEEEIEEDLVLLNITINEGFATTEMIQCYKNISNNPIELSLDIPLLPEIQLNKFIAIMDDKKYISKILPKEKAKEKYNDAIAEGNTGIISKYNENSNSYKIQIGNLLPKKIIKLKTYFSQYLTSKDMGFCYTIMEDFPYFIVNKYSSIKRKKLKAKIELNTFSKILRLTTRELNSTESYSREFNDNFTKCNITYENKEINNQYRYQYNIPFSIIFRTENSYELNLFSQYNPKKDETSYILSYLYSKNNSSNKIINNDNFPDERKNISYIDLIHKKEINSNPGLFIFLIDQSGSMRGKPIELVSESLLIFLQSLPKNSYYQLIGFGSTFEKYNSTPVFYNRENVNETFNLIKKISANKGGTNISKPLIDIFKNSYDDYKDIHLPRNIFLLTDGEVDDKKKTLDLISQHNNKFRIHALGIGNDFDKQLIENSGRLGKGSYNFVKDINNINDVVIKTLNNCMINYGIDPSFKCQNNIIIDSQPINDIIYEDETLVYSFIMKGKEEKDIEINFKIKDNEAEIEDNLIIEKENIHKLNEGDSLGKIIIGTILKYNKNISEEEEKNLAKEYQVLSKNTTLYAEIENEESINSEMITYSNTIDENKDIMDEIQDSYKYYKSNLSYKLKMDEDLAFENNFRCKETLCMSSPGSIKCCSMKKSSGFPSLGIGKFFGGIKNTISNIFSSDDKNETISFAKSSAPKSTTIKNLNNKINNNNDEQKKFSLNDMILTQDIIDGFWDENKHTKFILSKYQKEYNKIENYLKEINCKEYKNMAVTFIILYYLKKEESSKLQSYMIIINKAETFLINCGISYDTILLNNKI